MLLQWKDAVFVANHDSYGWVSARLKTQATLNVSGKLDLTKLTKLFVPVKEAIHLFWKWWNLYSYWWFHLLCSSKYIHFMWSQVLLLINLEVPRAGHNVVSMIHSVALTVSGWTRSLEFSRKKFLYWDGCPLHIAFQHADNTNRYFILSLCSISLENLC